MVAVIGTELGKVSQDSKTEKAGKEEVVGDADCPGIGSSTSEGAR